MPYTPHTRMIAPDDLDIVRDLALAIWPRCYRQTIAPTQIDSMASELFDLDLLEQDMENGHVYWVVSVNQRDVGFICAHMDGARVWVTKLYVLADYRGMGLGKSLISTARAWFAPAQHMALCVHKDHPSAVDFCLHSGFAIANEIPHNLGQYGFTDYVMHMDLRH